MTDDQGSATDLRGEAEKKLAHLEEISGVGGTEEIRKLIHELRVHQIELEMQNAQLAKTHAELERSREKYSDLFDFAPVGYVSLDENGLILEANLTVATLLGTERIRVINSPFQKWIETTDRDMFRLHLQKISRTKERDKCELRLKTNGGGEFYAQLDSLYVEEPDGKISCRTAVTDISERKMAEKALQKAHDELEMRVAERTVQLVRANEVLQDFASIASHDLREPLRKIKAFGDQLKTKFGNSLGETGRDYIDRMLNASKRMDAFIRALFDYSRVSTRGNPFSSVDLEGVVREVISDLEVKIAKTKGSVEVGNLPTLEADPTQMGQLFQNLIANGLKFHRDEPPVIKISGQPAADGQYQMLIQDNGIGFNEKDLDLIFAPFQRLRGRSEYEGTGMGLTICKKIVERHDGSITAKSKPGEGSTFIITLPVKRNS